MDTDAVVLSHSGYETAKRLVAEKRCVFDKRDDWSEHQPSAEAENDYIAKHGTQAYARWFLGEDTRQNEDTKGRYKFPYGDFERVHRCGVLAAESRAGQYKHFDIERAAAHLHSMIDELMERP